MKTAGDGLKGPDAGNESDRAMGCFLLIVLLGLVLAYGVYRLMPPPYEGAFQCQPWPCAERLDWIST